MAGLYFHIPFCKQRCIYCDFYFITSQKSHAGFLRSIRNEVEHYARQYAHREPIETVYFGGGTPSQLLLDEWFELMAGIEEHFDLSSVGEVTAEINPGDVDLDYFRELRRLGVNRLSIGIQSFYQADLEALNRSHSAEEAEEVIHMARTAGFDDLSIDLIFGIPDQPFEYWAANLEKASRLGVTHISTYNLTVEEGTPLGRSVARGLITPTPDEQVRELYDFTIQYLRENGYQHYEISSFARDGMRSRHNESYWNHSNYIGFGPSAHSFWWLGLPAVRWSNIRNLPRYKALLQQGVVPIEDREALALDRLANEYIMLRLRTSEGIDYAVLNDKYGVDLHHERKHDLSMLMNEGFLLIEDDHILLTDKGKHVANAVTERLLLEE